MDDTEGVHCCWQRLSAGALFSTCKPWLICMACKMHTAPHC